MNIEKENNAPFHDDESELYDVFFDETALSQPVYAENLRSNTDYFEEWQITTEK